MIAGVEDGILIDGRGSYSIDQQRYNFQFGGDAFWEIKNGKKRHDLAACVSGEVRQTSGRHATASRGQLLAAATVFSATAKASRTDQRNVATAARPRGSGRSTSSRPIELSGVNSMMTRDQAHKLTEKVLKFATLPECSVNVDENESSFVRFANNGVTTAGFTVERTVTIWQRAKAEPA